MPLFVVGVVCLMQAIPVFADDDTKTKIDFNNGASCIIKTESQIYYTEYSYDDIVVPVYMNLQGISGSPMYYSGYIYGSTNAFNFTDSNSNRYVISYFESANDNIRTTYFRTNAFWNIYLDNVIISNNNSTLIGYLHLMGNEQNPTLTLYCNNALQTINVTAHMLYSTGYEFGFVNAMVYALDNSTNLDGMYDILNHIENASLPEILTTIQTNHSALYNLINSVWLTDQSVLSVSQQTYNTVLSILNILNDHYSSQVNQADTIKDEVDTNLQNLAKDINVTKPSQVANIADDYIEQVDTTHNYQVFSWLTAPTFVLMMSIVAGLAVISYMLYGGQ